MTCTIATSNAMGMEFLALLTAVAIIVAVVRLTKFVREHNHQRHDGDQ